MNIFRHFTVKKTSFSQPAEKLSYLYFRWVAYLNAICKECLLKKTCIRDEISWIMREKKSSETVFWLILSGKKTLSFHQ